MDATIHGILLNFNIVSVCAFVAMCTLLLVSPRLHYIARASLSSAAAGASKPHAPDATAEPLWIEYPGPGPLVLLGSLSGGLVVAAMAVNNVIRQSRRELRMASAEQARFSMERYRSKERDMFVAIEALNAEETGPAESSEASAQSELQILSCLRPLRAEMHGWLNDDRRILGNKRFEDIDVSLALNQMRSLSQMRIPAVPGLEQGGLSQSRESELFSVRAEVPKELARCLARYLPVNSYVREMLVAYKLIGVGVERRFFGLTVIAETIGAQIIGSFNRWRAFVDEVRTQLNHYNAYASLEWLACVLVQREADLLIERVIERRTCKIRPQGHRSLRSIYSREQIFELRRSASEKNWPRTARHRVELIPTSAVKRLLARLALCGEYSETPVGVARSGWFQRVRTGSAPSADREASRNAGKALALHRTLVFQMMCDWAMDAPLGTVPIALALRQPDQSGPGLFCQPERSSAEFTRRSHLSWDRLVSPKDQLLKDFWEVPVEPLTPPNQGSSEG